MKKLSNHQLGEILNGRFATYEPDIPQGAWDEISSQLDGTKTPMVLPKSLLALMIGSALIGLYLTYGSPQAESPVLAEGPGPIESDQLEAEPAPSAEPIMSPDEKTDDLDTPGIYQQSEPKSQKTNFRSTPSITSEVSDQKGIDNASDEVSIPDHMGRLNENKSASGTTQIDLLSLHTTPKRTLSFHDQFNPLSLIDSASWRQFFKPQFSIGFNQGFIQNRIVPIENDVFLAQRDQQSKEPWNNRYSAFYMSLKVPIKPRWTINTGLGFAFITNTVSVERFNTNWLPTTQRTLPAEQIRQLEVYERQLERVSRKLSYSTFDLSLGVSYQPFVFRSNEFLDLNFTYIMTTKESGNEVLKAINPPNYFGWEIGYRARLKLGENHFWVRPFYATSFGKFKGKNIDDVRPPERLSYDLRPQYFGVGLSFELRSKKANSLGGSRE